MISTKFFNTSPRGARFGGESEVRAINKNHEEKEIQNHRYTLWRRWGADNPRNHPGDYLRSMVAFIGLNPSTATPEKLDPTLTRCERFAKDWGYLGFIMLNLFSYRATSPGDMKKVIDPTGDPVNIDAIYQVTKASGLVVCAWGNHGSFMNRSRTLLNLLRVGKIDHSHLGLTKSGEPKHPLYLKSTTIPVSF